MKNLLIAVFFLLSIASCKKEDVSQAVNSSHTDNGNQNQSEYLRNVKNYLKDSLSKEDLKNIRFEKAILTKFNNGKIYLLRLQFKKTDNEFILLRTDEMGNCSKGRIVNIKYSNSENQTAPYSKPHSFNGNIFVSSLDRHPIRNIKIKNGYKEKQKGNVGDMLVADDNTLPDVTVTAYISPQGGITYADWYNLLDVYPSTDWGFNYGGTGGGGGSTSYGYYSPVDPYSDPYYGNTSGGDIPVDDPKRIEYENPLLLPAISVADYLKCFDNISDIGATCSIEIFTDLPVNGEPNTFFNWNTSSPGHTFLQIKKVSGYQTIQQNIGFYPNHDWKTLAYTPVAGKLVDDGGHEFNASLKMNLTFSELHSVITEIETLSNSIAYDVDQYNCTDFALQVFNSVRPRNELTIPLYIVPGETLGIQSKTPQGLYQKLSSMKEAGVSEAVNITIANVCGFVAASNGPCN